MGRKPASESSALVTDGFQDRIIHLAELIWKGNRSQMGRDLGVDQSSLSKVLASKQQPSAALIERLANWKGVNPGWLLCGKGEPLLEGPFSPGVGLYRPLLDELIPGPLAEFPAASKGVSYPVAAAHYTETNYWLRVPPRHPVTVKNSESVLNQSGVNVHDLLLMETDPAWTRSAPRVRGKLVALLVGDAHATNRRMVFGKVGPDSEPVYAELSGVQDINPVTVYAGEKAERVWLVVPGDREAVRQAAAALKGEVVTLEQIIAVRVCLLRPSW